MERARRLAAVWFADIAGYTALSSVDEDAALRTVECVQALARAAVAERDGRVVKHIGDAVLAVFDSAEGALQAALRLQEAFAASDAAAQYGVALRMGVHLGEVVEAPDGDVYGDGVNTASRVEGAAEPGSVLVTQAVQHQIRNRAGFVTRSRGRHSLKGLAEPLTLYEVTLAAAYDRPPPRIRAHAFASGRTIAAGLTTGIVAFVGLSIFIAQTEQGSEEPPLPTATTLAAVSSPGAGERADGASSAAPADTGRGAGNTTADSAAGAAAKLAEAASVAAVGAVEGVDTAGDGAAPRAAVASGWKRIETVSLMDDAPLTSLILRSTMGATALLVLRCGTRVPEASIAWDVDLSQGRVRSRLDGGRDRDASAQWQRSDAATTLRYQGDVRRLIRDLRASRTFTIQTSGARGQALTTRFVVTGLAEVLRGASQC